MDWTVHEDLTFANKTLVQLGMPTLNQSANNPFERDLRCETQFDVDK
jgi:hypothetical protein